MHRLFRILNLIVVNVLNNDHLVLFIVLCLLSRLSDDQWEGGVSHQTLEQEALGVVSQARVLDSRPLLMLEVRPSEGLDLDPILDVCRLGWKLWVDKDATGAVCRLALGIEDSGPALKQLPLALDQLFDPQLALGDLGLGLVIGHPLFARGETVEVGGELSHVLLERVDPHCRVELGLCFVRRLLK